jgi:preprotein translocase subunit SecE
MQRIIAFIQSIREEFNRINWPAGKDTVRMTGVVIIMSLIVAVFLGAIDYALLYGMNNYLLQ